MGVVIPAVGRAIASKYALESWLGGNPGIQLSFSSRLEDFKSLLIELNHEDQVDKEKLVPLLAHALGECDSLVAWIVEDENYPDAVPTTDGEWFAIFTAAAWYIFQSHERELRRQQREEEADEQVTSGGN